MLVRSKNANSFTYWQGESLSTNTLVNINICICHSITTSLRPSLNSYIHSDTPYTNFREAHVYSNILTPLQTSYGMFGNVP